MLLKFIICKKKEKRKTIDGAFSKKKKKKNTNHRNIIPNRWRYLDIPPIKFPSQYSKERQIRRNIFSPSLVRQMRISLMNNYAFNSRQMMRREGGLFEIVPIFGKMIIKPINLAAFGDISGSSTNNTGKLNNYGCDRRVCTFRGGAIHARFYECRD